MPIIACDCPVCTSTDPRDTRTVLGIALSVVRTTPIEGTDGYGVFRL